MSQIKKLHQKEAFLSSTCWIFLFQTKPNFLSFFSLLKFTPSHSLPHPFYRVSLILINSHGSASEIELWNILYFRLTSSGECLYTSMNLDWVSFFSSFFCVLGVLGGLGFGVRVVMGGNEMYRKRMKEAHIYVDVCMCT